MCMNTVVAIEKDTHKRLKKYCEANGLIMSKYVTMVINDKLKEN